MTASTSEQSWRRVGSTPWMQAGAARVGLARFLGATWPLPSWAPATSVRHTLSPLLPPPLALVRLVRALHGRLVVANQSPVAAFSPADRALVRGLVGAVLDGLPASPWPDAPRDASATWPAESRVAHAQVLAHAWLQAHGLAGAMTAGSGRGDAVAAVALYQGPSVISLSDDGTVGPEHGPDVRARIATRLPPRTLAIPRVIATIPYRVVVVRAATRDDLPPASLTTGQLEGAATPGTVWFSGSVLLPDPALVAAMDAPSRRRWAARTGRGGGQDAYWYPDSWARFLEPGRFVGHVSAATVGQSIRVGRGPRDGIRGSSFGPAVERGLCVPPGYGLVECVGTLATSALVL